MRNPSSARRGFALVAVLLLIAVIAAIAFEFSHDSRVRFHLADYGLKSSQALYCAEAGFAVAAAALQLPGDVWADEDAVRVLSGAVPISVGEGHCTVSVVQESGKVNVNGLKMRDGQIVRHRVDQLLRLIDVLNAQHPEEDSLGYGIVPAIIDWTDSDDEITILPFIQGDNAGAEDDYYRNLEPSYRCRNAPFETLGELMLVKGVRHTVAPGGIASPGTGSGAGLWQYLTVYGDDRVNVNQAHPTVLQSLSEQIDAVLALSIASHRPYRSLRELAKVPGMTPEVLGMLQGLVTVRSASEYYTITCRGTVGPCTRTVQTMVKRDRGSGRLIRIVRSES